MQIRLHRHPLLLFLLGLTLPLQSISAECKLEAGQRLPQLILVGEAHAENLALSALPEGATEDDVRASTTFRKTLFEEARSGHFPLASEIYMNNAGDQSAPFFPELHDRFEKDHEIYGLESSEIRALNLNYGSTWQVYIFPKNPNRGLSEMIKNSLWHTIDYEVFADLLKTYAKDPKRSELADGVRTILNELKSLRENRSLQADFALGLLPSEAKVVLNKLEFEKLALTKEQIRQLALDFHHTLVAKANHASQADFEELVDSEDPSQLAKLRQKTSQQRDRAFAKEAVPLICKAAREGQPYFVFNMGGAHIPGFESEVLKDLAPLKPSVARYLTYNPEELRKLKIRLPEIAAAGKSVPSPDGAKAKK